MPPSYTHGVFPVPLIGKTIGTMLDDLAAEFGANEALVSVFENRRLTYANLREEVDRCARAFMAMGLAKGDRVGIWSTNCIAWVIVQFASAKVGAILVNINPAYRLSELEFALNQSQTNCLIIGEGFRDACYADMLAKLHGASCRICAQVISLTPESGAHRMEGLFARSRFRRTCRPGGTVGLPRVR